MLWSVVAWSFAPRGQMKCWTCLSCWAFWYVSTTTGRCNDKWICKRRFQIGGGDTGGNSLNLKALVLEFLVNRRTWENQNPPKNRLESGCFFCSEPCPLHCTQFAHCWKHVQCTTPLQCGIAGRSWHSDFMDGFMGVVSLRCHPFLLLELPQSLGNFNRKPLKFKQVKGDLEGLGWPELQWNGASSSSRSQESVLGVLLNPGLQTFKWPFLGSPFWCVPILVALNRRFWIENRAIQNHVIRIVRLQGRFEHW